MSRFANRKKIINKEKMYANIFKGRGVNQIEQYGTRFLRYPTQREVSSLILCRMFPSLMGTCIIN